jgi:hypothetical protein
MIQLHLDLLTLTIRTQEPSKEEFFEFLIDECPDIKILIDSLNLSSSYNETRYASLWQQFMAVKGHVQSGKTNFMVCVSLLYLWLGQSVIILVRNLQADSNQFLQRWDAFRAKSEPYVPKVKVIKSSTSITKRKTPALYICLGNQSSLKKMISIVPEKQFVLCIDEVDALDLGRGSQRSLHLATLKERACITFGISATMMDPLCKEQNPKLLLLNTPSDYKGIHDIIFKPLSQKAQFSATIESDLVDNNPDLMPFIDLFIQRPAVAMPHIVLLNIGRTVQPYLSLQKDLSKKYPSLATLILHAKGISMSIDGVITLKTSPLSSCLQWLKENGGIERFPHIVIGAGELAGRGLSFTDLDYEWHLTDLYLIVSKTCDEAELIQKIRLCGRYKDTTSLLLHTTPSIYSDLIKAYYRQEEVVTTLHGVDEPYKEHMGRMTLSESKFSKRSMTKHAELPIQKGAPSLTEWSDMVYQGLQLPPKEAYTAYGQDASQAGLASHMGVDIQEQECLPKTDADEMKRLANKMFPMWAKQLGQTRISKWIDALEPRRLYTRDEIGSLCKEHDIIFQHVMVLKYSKSGSRGYGEIMEREGNYYRLRPQLIASHDTYFLCLEK